MGANQIYKDTQIPFWSGLSKTIEAFEGNKVAMLSYIIIFHVKVIIIFTFKINNLIVEKKIYIYIYIYIYISLGMVLNWSSLLYIC